MRQLNAVLLFAIATYALFRPAWSQTSRIKYPTIGRVIREDSRLDRLIPRNAKIEVLASGMKFSEGPVWVKQDGYLLFSDIPRNSVMKWKEGEGLSLFMKPSGYTGVVEYGAEPGSNGLLIDPQGRVVFCEHGDRRIRGWSATAGRKHWSTVIWASA